jgi:beta-fructofuranosidase
VRSEIKPGASSTVAKPTFFVLLTPVVRVSQDLQYPDYSQAFPRHFSRPHFSLEITSRACHAARLPSFLPESIMRNFIYLVVFLCVTGNAFAQSKPFTDKTLVAWVKLANLTQRAGSVLTIETADGAFDALVFGEKESRRWMPGSEMFHRTPGQQRNWPEETATPEETIQVALVYRGTTVQLYRQGMRYAEHTIQKPVTFDEQSTIVMGLRHLDAGDKACFVGRILDARVYQQALSAEELAALKPHEGSDPKPLGWWDFRRDLKDQMGTFAAGQLHGKARLDNGSLLLPGNSYFTCNAQPTVTRATELWPRWHVSVLPEEGVALPYDANGCIYWKGKYHLMYIYQDPKRPHGGHCWGHLSSTDLVNWTYHPPALLSELSGTDVGIFSGNAFLSREGKPMLCWFGINGGVCVAEAEDDELIRWKKHPKNPIVPMPKKGEPNFGKYTVWDPYLWYEKGQYWCLLGGNYLPNKKDTLYLCTSPDLVTWTPKHAFFEHADLKWTVEGEDCSCPDFFKIGNKHALLCISHRVGSRLYLGRFDTEKEKFFPEQHIRMNWPGGTYFAPESLLDEKGRRIFWGWIVDPRKMRTQRATGSGVQSMPRLLGLAKDGGITIEPVPELQTLREKKLTIPTLKFGDTPTVLNGIAGTSLELQLSFDVGNASEVGVQVYVDPKTGEETTIRYIPKTGTLSIDVSKSTKRRDLNYAAVLTDHFGAHHNPKLTVEAPLPLKDSKILHLHLFIDGPVLEVFANGCQCVTQMVYPQSKDANQIRVYSRGSQAMLYPSEAWTLGIAKFDNHKNHSIHK